MDRALGAGVVSDGTSDPLDVVALHRAHAGFVWKTLLRLGARESDAPDLLQEVFVVVHRRRADFDPSQAKVTSWLYGICLRLVQNHRRRAYVSRERPTDDIEIGADAGEARRSDARLELARILDEISPERRALIIMFEVEGMSCAEIADTLGVPVGTVYSRLAAARDDLVAAALRARAREKGVSR